MHKILYLHGFNSSPGSHKARVLHAHLQDRKLEDRIDIPSIPPLPADAMEVLRKHADAITKHADLSLVGSSLGGFYATWLAEHYECPAVLINPAVRPHELLKHYLGQNTNVYTHERWMLDQSHIEQFRQLYIDRISSPQRYLLLLQTGDETLDYREAVERYKGCTCVIEEGGSHEFTGFERHLDEILSFCKVS